MKPVGLIGGTTWVSTQHYYAQLNRAYQAHFGGLSSAPIIINSVDFAPVAKSQANEQWQDLGQVMADKAQQLERAGCSAIAIGANTMHLCFDAVAAAVDVPVLHIGDGIAAELGHQRTLLLGTAFTMSKPFLTQHLRDQGCLIDLPTAQQQATIHRFIYDELAKDIASEQAKSFFEQLAQDYQGDTILLACTELGLVLSNDTTTQTVVDSLTCHVDMMLKHLIAQA